jgi:hypothetical protein
MKQTPEGEYSVTKSVEAKMIVDTIMDVTTRYDIDNDAIVDATACCGGDTMSFAKAFPYVTAVELKRDNFNQLRRNVGMRRGVRLLHDDFTLCYERFSAPIAYIDAPWGGPDYYKASSLMLNLSGIPLDEFVVSMLRNSTFKVIALKVPINFAFDRFYDTIKMAGYGDAVIDTHKIMPRGNMEGQNKGWFYLMTIVVPPPMPKPIIIRGSGSVYKCPMRRVSSGGIKKQAKSRLLFAQAIKDMTKPRW